MSQMTIPRNFQPSREMPVVYFHASVTQSQGIVWFLLPSQINKNKPIESQNNLKPLGPRCTAEKAPKLLCLLQHFTFHGELMNQTGQDHAVSEVPQDILITPN